MTRIATITLWMLGLLLHAGAANLLPNGDFAQLGPDGATPAGWRVAGRGAGTHEVRVDHDVTCGGKYTLRVAATGAPANETTREGGVTVVSPTFPIVAGQTYRLVLDLRAEGLREIRDAQGMAPGARYVTVILYFLDADAKYVANDTMYQFADVAEFAPRELTATAPPGAAQAKVQMWVANYARDGVAVAWFGNIRVETVAGAEAAAAYPPSGRRLYTGEAETVNRFREEHYLDNVALGAPAAANSVLNAGTRHAHPGERAVDGDEMTGWVGEVRDRHEGDWVLTVTLPEAREICGVYWVRHPSERHPDRAPENYTIRVSPDGTAWETVARGEGYGYSNRCENFAPVRARFVEMAVERVQVGSRNGPEIKELKAFTRRPGVVEDYAGWWDRHWYFRTRLAVPAGEGARTVRVPVDFSRVTDGMAGPFLEDSIRVVRSGVGEDMPIPALFLRAADYDARTRAAGTLLFLRDADPQATYYCYFDTGLHGAKDPAVFQVPGVRLAPSFTTTGWAVQADLAAAEVRSLTVRDDRDAEVATVADGAAVALDFGREYYARVTRADGSTTCVWLPRPTPAALPPDLQRLYLPRPVFVRGEEIPVRTVLTNAGATPLDVGLTVAIEDGAARTWYRQAATARLAPATPAEQTLLLPAVNLAPGEYALKFAIRAADGTYLAVPRTTALHVVEDQPIRFLYGIFGPGGVTRGNKDWHPTLAAMAAAGINAVAGNDPATMDDYLLHGLKALGKIHYQLDIDINADPAEYAAVDQFGEYVLPPYKGSIWYPNYTSPAIQAAARQAFRDYLEEIKDHPGFSGYIFSNDDYQLPAPVVDGVRRICGYSATDKARFRELTGHEPPLPTEVELKRGIIPDDDLWARFVRFRCEELFAKGNNQLRVEVKNEVAPGAKFGNVHGPMQDNFYAPIAGLYPPGDQAVCDFVGGYSYLNQWRQWKRYTTYGSLCRMGKRNRQPGRELIMLPPLGDCATGFTEGADGLYQADGHLNSDWGFRNQAHQLLAGGFNGLWFYLWSHNGRAVTDKPALLAEVTRFGTLLREYGPFLKSIHVADRPVGILVSITDSAYGSFFLPASEHRNDNGCWLNDKLLAAHVPAETFAEDEIADGILDKYRVVVVYDIMVMKASVARALEAYVAAGGTVLLVGSDDLNLAGAEHVPLDSRRTAAAMIARLRELVVPPADTAADDLTVNTFTDGTVDYLYIVDCFFDKYCYDVRGAHPEYWDGSKWQVDTIQVQPRHEQIVLTGRPAHVVDVFGRRELPVTPTAGGCTFPVDLRPGGGMLVALYPQLVQDVRLRAPARVARGAVVALGIGLLGDDGRPFAGHVPVAVEVRDATGELAWLRTTEVVRGGGLDLELRTALNQPPGPLTVRVTELTTGKAGQTTVALD